MLACSVTAPRNLTGFGYGCCASSAYWQNQVHRINKPIVEESPTSGST
nr:uncharacterized protein CTRU02_01281 [Colletotrichum truncatum]KAF6800876.1 hypothetical protein CTRU02_01281 [Colletotrichum truncatum]